MCVRPASRFFGQRMGTTSSFICSNSSRILGASQFHAYVTGTNYPAISGQGFLPRLKLLVPKDKLEKRFLDSTQGYRPLLSRRRGKHCERRSGAKRADAAIAHRPPQARRAHRAAIQTSRLTTTFGRLPRSWQSARGKNLIASCEYGLSRAMSAHGQYPIFRNEQH